MIQKFYTHNMLAEIRLGKGNIIPNNQAYMKYADMKLREEEQRATKYLESCSGKYQNLYLKSTMLVVNDMIYSIT